MVRTKRAKTRPSYSVPEHGPVLRKSRRSVVPELEDLFLVPTLGIQVLRLEERKNEMKRGREEERDLDLHTSILSPLTSDPRESDWRLHGARSRIRTLRDDGIGVRDDIMGALRDDEKFSFSPERSERLDDDALSALTGNLQRTTYHGS